MYRRFLKVLSLALTLTMCLTFLCSCQDKKHKKTADEEVLSVTDDFCRAILDGDSDEVSDLANDDFDDESCSKVLKYYYNNPSWDSTKLDIADFILHSMTYRIDKNSVLASYEKGTGTVDVYFSYVDYVKCFETSKANSLRDYFDELKVYKDKAFTKISIDYVNVDDEWLLEDYEKTFIDLFSWKEFEFNTFANFDDSITLFKIFDSGLDYDSNEDAYVDVSHFTVVIDVQDAFSTGWTSTFCYLYLEDEPIEYANVFYDFEHGHDYTAEFDSIYALNETTYPSGNYKILMFDSFGSIIQQMEFKMVRTSGGAGAADNSNEQEFVFGNAPLLNNVDSANWWSRYNGVSFELDLRTNIDMDDVNLYFKIGDVDENFVYESEMMTFATNNRFIEVYAEVDIDTNSSYYLYLYDEDDNLVVRAKMFK